MSTVYKYKKCNIFGFSRSAETVKQKYNYCLTFDDNNFFKKFSDEFIQKNIEDFTDPDTYDTDLIPTFIINLESTQFNDINILTEENTENDKSKEKIKRVTNLTYKHNDKELSKVITGQSSQLEAFSKNLYTVIYGKKTSNIQQGRANSHIFNHNVIDSLAKNGVICDQVSNEVLSVQLVFRELEKLRKFNIFFVHTQLDLEYIEHESPSEISHPVYLKGAGEICAIFYRSLILYFFPYLTITTESMRENAYLF